MYIHLSTSPCSNASEVQRSYCKHSFICKHFLFYPDFHIILLCTDYLEINDVPIKYLEMADVASYGGGRIVC